MNKLIITCGTSLFTNISRDKSLYAFSNYTTDNIPADGKEKIDRYYAAAKSALCGVKTSAELCGMSAELNTIASYYGDFTGVCDELFFLHTDTYLGKLAAGLYAEFLGDRFGLKCYAVRVPGLRTDSFENFNRGLASLYSDEFLKLYKNPSGKVIFVLSGGFKSWSGYMQSIGMLYADEILYQFESGGHLISIPKIPVKADLADNAVMALKLILSGADITDEVKNSLPAAAYTERDGKILLTNMGKLLLDISK